MSAMTEQRRYRWHTSRWLAPGSWAPGYWELALDDPIDPETFTQREYDLLRVERARWKQGLRHDDGGPRPPEERSPDADHDDPPSDALRGGGADQPA